MTQYDQLIRNAVREFMPADYDWRIYRSQIRAESNFDPDAVSPVGARGIAQIMPATWDQWKLDSYDNPFDPEQSIMTGCRYMGYLVKQWSWARPELDRACLALSSYNAGLGHLLSAQKLSGGAVLYSEIIRKLPEVTGSHSKETIEYVQKILGYYIDEVTG